MPAYSRKIEALAEAIAKVSGYLDPASKLYAARNPGGIKAVLPEQLRDSENNRVYASLLDGYQSLLHDLAIKLSGRSRSRLTPESSISDLAAHFHIAVARPVALFLRAALRDDSIQPSTQLSYFQE
jgi:hypothetical protein